MAADGVSTLRALPFFGFYIHKFFNPVLFHVVLVLYHAHMVSYPVAFIDSLQIMTGEIGTLITEFDFSLFKQFAAFFEVGALFISDAAAAAVRDFDSLAFHIELESQVAGAYPAVNTAGGNQVLVPVHVRAKFYILSWRCSSGGVDT